MSEKMFNTRIVHKHDTEANWNKATNFIPKQGELIVYDIDDNYGYQRLKIGDGVAYVKDLAFLSDIVLYENSLIGATDQITPEQVTEALTKGKTIVITHTDAEWGQGIFTNFTWLKATDVVNSSGSAVLYQNKVPFKNLLFNLKGRIGSNSWELEVNEFALKTDVPQIQIVTWGADD